jgi:hypothetical protein
MLQPPLSVPIRIVELNNIPVELRTGVHVPRSQNDLEKKLEKNIYRDSAPVNLFYIYIYICVFYDDFIFILKKKEMIALFFY